MNYKIIATTVNTISSHPLFPGDWYIWAVLKFVPGARKELQLEFASSHVSHSTSASQAQTVHPNARH